MGICSSKAVVEKQPEYPNNSLVYRYRINTEIKEEANYVFNYMKPNLGLERFEYLDLINSDIKQLEISLFEELSNKVKPLSKYQTLYIGIKWTLLGAFFASKALYGSAADNDRVLSKFRNVEIELHDGTDSKIANFLDEGIKSFVFLRDFFQKGYNFWPIYKMYQSHESLVELVSTIASKIAEEVNNNFAQAKEKSKQFITESFERKLLDYSEIYTDSESLYNKKYSEIDRTTLYEFFKKSFYFPKDKFTTEESDSLNFGFLLGKIFLFDLLMHWFVSNNKLEELVIEILLNDFGIETHKRIEIEEINPALTFESDGGVEENKEDEIQNIPNDYSNSTFLVVRDGFRAEQSNSVDPSPKFSELSSATFKPDDNSDGAAIKITQNSENTRSNGFILDWIDVIDASWLKNYLLSLKVIQDMQQAIEDMYSKLKEVKHYDYSAMYKNDEPQNQEIKYMEDMELARSSGLDIFMHADSAPLINLNGDANLFGPIF